MACNSLVRDRAYENLSTPSFLMEKLMTKKRYDFVKYWSKKRTKEGAPTDFRKTKKGYQACTVYCYAAKQISNTVVGG